MLVTRPSKSGHLSGHGPATFARHAGGALALLWCSVLPTPARAAPAQAADAAATRFVLCDDYCAVVNKRGALVVPRLFDKVLDVSGPDIVFANGDPKTGKDTMGLLNPDGVQVRTDDRSALESVPGAPFLSDGESLYRLDGTRVLHQPGKQVGVWRGHPYYRDCPRGNQCDWSAATFTDGNGNIVAHFADMPGDLSGTLIPASRGGTHYGYVDGTLAFRIPAVYLKAQPFSGSLAHVHTAAGDGLIDTAGKYVVEPGRFSRLLYDETTLFIVGFPADDPDCALLLHPDGRRVDLPHGVCAAATRDTRTLSYFPVGGPTGFGVVDAAGKPTVAPHYAALKPLGAHYLAFSSRGDAQASVGVMTPDGQVVVGPKYLDAQPGPGDTFLLRTAEGWGLAGADGQWLATPHFREPRLLDADLLALTEPAKGQQPKRVLLFGADGKQLPVSSLYDPQPVQLFVPRDNVRAFKVYAAGKTPSQSTIGLIGLDGQVIVPFMEHVSEFVDLGDGLWRVKLDDSATGPDPVYTQDGRRVDALSRFHKLEPFRDGVATARTVGDKEDAVLVNTQGTVLTSFATLFPGVQHLEGGPYNLLDQAINRCYVADPTVYAVYPPPRKGADALICEDTALSRLSEQTERAYAIALAATPWPEQLLALRPAYEEALAACADAACVHAAMASFKQTVDRTAAAIRKPVLTEAKRPEWSLPAAQTRAIARQVAATKEYRDWFLGDGGAAPGKTPLENLNIRPSWLGGQRMVLVTPREDDTDYMGPERNEPSWWLLPEGKDRWRMVYSGQGTVTTQYRAGEAMPILVTNYASQNGIWDDTYSRYDGRRYVPYLGCEAFYEENPAKPGGDGNTLMTCDSDATAGRAVSEPAVTPSSKPGG